MGNLVVSALTRSADNSKERRASTEPRTSPAIMSERKCLPSATRDNPNRKGKVKIETRLIGPSKCNSSINKMASMAAREVCPEGNEYLSATGAS